MSRSITDGELFLREYHRRHSGITPILMGDGRSPDGRSSYQVLADLTTGRDRVLDLACGDGPLLALLTSAGHTATGVDMSDAELAAARRRPGLDSALVRGRAQELPFRAGSFDACVSHMAFMLMTDPTTVAAELARVLVPGGLLAITTGGPTAAGAHNVLRTLLRELVSELPDSYRLPPLGDRRVYSQDGLDEVLGSAGFAPVTFWTVPLSSSGSVEQAWRVATGIYDIELLDDDMVAGLRTGFDAGMAAIALPDGSIPWTIVLNFATAQLG